MCYSELWRLHASCAQSALAPAPFHQPNYCVPGMPKKGFHRAAPDLEPSSCTPQEVAEAEAKKPNSRIGQHEGKDMLQLLRNCSGAFRPGILTALVGSSGAGKTTLMDVLAGRKTSASFPRLPESI